VTGAGGHAPSHLDARIDAFLKDFEKKIEALTAEDLEGHKEALIADKMQKDHSLSDEACRNWEQIANKRCGTGSLI